MSSSTELATPNTDSMNDFSWSSSGTAKKIFLSKWEQSELPAQPRYEKIPAELTHLKQYFLDKQLGSEYFFQIFEWLKWETEKNSSALKVNSPVFVCILFIHLLLRKAVNSGNTCLPVEKVNSEIKNYFCCSSPENQTNNFSVEKMIKDAFVFLEQSPLFLKIHSNLYFDKYWKFENQLAQSLLFRLKMETGKVDSEQVNEALKFVLEEHPVRFDGKPLELAEEQKEAVIQAVSSPFLIISGGPGTGKTSVAVTILRVLKRLGLAENPGLAAPTGRAAKRMAESVSDSLKSIEGLEQMQPENELLYLAGEAKTLHRLLSYHAGFQQFQRNENDPLEHDLLIIDEVSMIELKLMTSLLNASHSNIAHLKSVPRLILMGDAQQLPSVGSGAVLSELSSEIKEDESELEKSSIPVVKLKKSYRQKSTDPAGRNILGVAKKIIQTETETDLERLFETDTEDDEIITQISDFSDFDHQKVFLLKQVLTRKEMSQFAQWCVKQHLSDSDFISLCQTEFIEDQLEMDAGKLDLIFSHINQFKILTATKKAAGGSFLINQMIKKGMTDGNPELFQQNEHYPGEPVMITENLYSQNLFNGDQGIYLLLRNQKTKQLELKIVFLIEGKYHAFFEHELRQLQTSYAITVHKSQGSEYNHVYIILPALSDKHSVENQGHIQDLLSREMFYTALTRAKKSVLIVGEKCVLESSMLQDNKRYSGLRAALFSR